MKKKSHFVLIFWQCSQSLPQNLKWLQIKLKKYCQSEVLTYQEHNLYTLMVQMRWGVQRRYSCEAPFSIYVNCQCHRLTLCFEHLVNKFPWLSEKDKLLSGLWKTFHYSSLNRHIFSKLQQAHDSQPRHLVKAAVIRWLPDGQACKKEVFLFLFLIGIHSMQGWTATTRHGVITKEAQKRLQDTENLFRKNVQLKGVC